MKRGALLLLIFANPVAADAEPQRVWIDLERPSPTPG